jgi:hypothetical protein
MLKTVKRVSKKKENKFINSKIMRKVLLTVMMVTSLLAFNACKKDGAVGPQGPAGPTGATGAAGAAGAVGAAGAAGKDGSKILPTTGAPATTLGAQGDYAFDAATKILYGPKTSATAWPAAGVALSGADGAKGATGATGTNGTQFLAGDGAPTAGTGATGDFYFDKQTSIFYGPKLADGTWGTNSLPLGRAYAAKRYTITRGFETVTEVAGARQIGEDLVPTSQYPGWGDDREMIFQSNPVGAPGIFDVVPTSSAALGVFPYDVGAKFRYSRNKSGVALPGGGVSTSFAEFTLTASDIARLQDNGGLAFGYLTYAKALPSSVVLGGNLVFARSKNVQIKQNAANYSTKYTAFTKFNLNTLVPDYEKYKQEGKVYVKYKYYSANPTNSPVLNSNGNAGWIDLTTYANSYVIPTVSTDPTTGYSTGGLTDVNPFVDALAGNFMGSGAKLGTFLQNVTVGANQIAAAQNVTTGTVANRTTNLDGNIVINWNITSGTNYGAPVFNTVVGPTTLQNDGLVLDPVTAAFANDAAAPGTARFIPRVFETTYYSTPALTATKNDGSSQPITGAAPNQTIPQQIRNGGQPASYFTSTKLVQFEVLVLPGAFIQTLKAKGVNVDNVNEVSKYVKL